MELTSSARTASMDCIGTSHQLISVHPISQENPPRDASACVTFSPGHPHTVLYSSSLIPGRVIWFDYRQSKVVRHIDLPGGIVTSLAASANGVRIAAGSQRGSVFLIDCASCRWREMMGHREGVVASRFCSCNTKLLSASGTILMVWNVGEG